MTSILAFKDPNAKVMGLNDIPKDERPPVPLVFWGFRIMVGLGVYFILMAMLGIYLYRKDKLMENRLYLKMLLYSIPLPYIAINLGWMVAEVGRQPWIVYGLMKTSDGVSPIAASQVLTSLIGVIVFYTILVGLDIYLIAKYAKRGPENIPPKIDVNQSTGLHV